MLLIIIFIVVLIVSAAIFGARTVGLFVAMLGFAALTSSPIIGIGLMVVGLILFVGMGN